MKNGKKNDSWIEFGEKIMYIYQYIFKEDEEKLIHYFSNHTSEHKKNSRKKTIKNWLAKKTKKPNNFHLSSFKIKEYKLNGELLLPLNAFKYWSLEKFQARVDLFLAEKENPNTPNQMKYIYFLNISEKKLSFFEINYPNLNDNLNVELSSDLYTSDMTYRGDIKHYNNITYITVKNEFDYMHYIFKNSVNVYKKEIKVFGVAQCIDAGCGEPKAFMALLTSEKLTEDEEQKYAHKLNFSNLIVADDFSYNCVVEKDFFLENFTDKISALGRDIHHYDINKNFATNMYFDIVLNEYQSYVQLLEKAIYHSNYVINNRRESILLSFQEMCKETKVEAVISYVLGSESISILDEKNPILETQLEMVRKDKLTLTYLFIVEDNSILNEKSISKIEYIKHNGIEVKMIHQSRTIYSKILWIKNHNFAMYKMQNQLDDNVEVTQDPNLVDKLTFEIKFLDRISVPLNEFINNFCTLNGKWYSYSYTSKQDQTSYQEVEFDIKNHKVTAHFPSKVEEGELHKNDEYMLVLLKHSIIKIHNINVRDTIFRISIIGKEKKIYNRDVLLFGLMSREKLKNEQVHMLLNSMYRKENEQFRLKISDEFDSILASFNIL